MMNNEALERLLAQQRSYFASGKTRSIHWRVEQLKKLKQAIIKYEPDILDALHADIGKPPMQAYGSEIFLCLHEINNALKRFIAGRERSVFQHRGICCRQEVKL